MERLQNLLDYIEQHSGQVNAIQYTMACQMALQLVQRDTQAELWAYLQSRLALSLMQVSEGNRANNLEQAITRFEQVLDVYTQEKFPIEWARVHYNVGNAYRMRIRGEREENLEQAIAHFEQALLVRTRQDFPWEWAMTQNSLGNVYHDYARGGQAENLEQAIFHYGQALEIYTRQDYPQLWAGTHHNLGSTYRLRMPGESADNIEQAIFHYEQALEVYTRQDFPVDWAMAQRGLGIAYQQRIQGTEIDNLEQVIFHFEQALEVYTSQEAQEDWVLMQSDLGLAYQVRVLGNYAENLEQVIFHYKQTLEVYTRQAFPYDWAGMQHNLGTFYSERLLGERTENVEQAIVYYEQALEVYTRQAFPLDWAKTQNNLANAYVMRIQGVRAENVEQAIALYEQVLEVYPLETYPEERSMLQNGLGNAYQQRIRGERAENLEQAIVYFKQALEVRTREVFPQEWAMLQNNLGIVYNERIHGEQAENLEQAIVHYKQALLVRDRQDLSRDWARTQRNLGGTYVRRIRGERAGNVEQAIGCFVQALEVYTQQDFPQDWAITQNGLGIAYGERVRGERAENLEQAILHLEKSLEVRTREAFLQDWAETQNNLGTAYYRRIQGERAGNIEQVITYSEQALTVYTKQTFPQEWAGLQNNLGLAYSERVRGEHAENVKQAVLHFEQALEVSTPLTFPQDCRDSAYWLGRTLYAERRYSEARRALEKAHQAVEALRGEVHRDLAKRALAERNADLYARLVACCLNEGDEAAAFVYAAAGKGRAFVDLLASARLDLSAASVSDPVLASDLLQARSLRQQIDNVLATLTGESGLLLAGSAVGPDVSSPLRSRETLYDQLKVLQEEDRRYWEEMAYKYPALTATQKAPALTVEQAKELAAELNATLVEYYRHAESWCAFVVSQHEVRAVPLPLVTDTLLERMAKWLGRLDDLEDEGGRSQISYVRLYEWHDAVIGPLEKHLSRDRPVVLSPFGLLHVLPLGVARTREHKRYVSEDYQVSFVPSLSALRSVWVQAQRIVDEARLEAFRRLLNVVYSGAPDSSNYLPAALSEAETIATHFSQVTALYQEKATPDEVLRQSRGQDVVHFGCHGWFDLEQPEQSGLLLAGGWLTVQRIIIELHLDQTRVVTLGACLSGREALRQGDEHVGLLQAMLTGGAQTVVASQWSVDDVATRALFETFYTSLAEGHSPAQALQMAQDSVRTHPEHEEWVHPYYWAAFQVSGLAHGM